MPVSRRGLLKLAGLTGVTGLAGCAQPTASSGSPTVTPAPVPTDRPTPVATSHRQPPPPDPEVLQFEVEVLAGFGETQPAQLEIRIENTGDTLLTGLGQAEYVFPFVDDDYVGVDWTGNPELLLVPRESAVEVAPGDADPAKIEAFLPEAPIDGCWSVPFDWPADRVSDVPALWAIPLLPGARERHRYELYYLEECTTGTFTFTSTFDLAVGDPPIERGLYRARLSFDVARSDTTGLLVRVNDPRIEPPGD
ncbi:MAG: hypothetical protein ABEH59_06870 [Halobacteriales archaeon]